MKHMYRCVLIGLLWTSLSSAYADEVAVRGDAAAGEKVFERVCLYCHTKGEESKFGPSLKWIGDRRDAAWLDAWLKNPAKMLEYDEYAQALVEGNEYGMTMPALPDMQDAQKRADVVAYLLSAF